MICVERTVGLFVLLLFAAACSKNDGLEPSKTSDVFDVPAHFPPPVYHVGEVGIGSGGFELGKRLFYDSRLSRDGTISCGSCHAQVHAFADHSSALSVGIDGNLSKRNAPALTNLAWYPNFMWDGGINHIEVMPIAPLTDPNEMDNDLSELVNYLQQNTAYPNEFEEVFGSKQIDSQKILLAIAAFQGSIVSYRSKYDDYLTGQSQLSALEIDGKNIFEAQCSSCHSGVLLTDFSFRNNGLDSTFADAGRATITQNEADLGKFKVPSLRNVALTNPYMHDGRIPTLRQVLDHYSEGIVESKTLDESLRNGLALTEAEKDALVAFLQTLTDYELLGDSRFYEP